MSTDNSRMEVMEAVLCRGVLFVCLFIYLKVKA